MQRNLILKLLILLFFTLVASTQTGRNISSYLYSLIVDKNFHSVVDDKFYRSGKLSNEDLAERIQEHGIKSVINLRRGGDRRGSDGRTQAEVVGSLGGSYYEVRLNSKRPPNDGRLEKLVELFDTVEKPIMVYCTSGTHRSGVAAAVWLLLEEGTQTEAALDQLTSRFGFFKFERYMRYYFSSIPTLDMFIWDFAEANKKDGVSFRQWYQQYIISLQG